MSGARPPVHLVIGSDGAIGRALAAALAARGRTVIGTTRRPNRVAPSAPLLDLSRLPTDWECPTEVEVAYLCAGVAGIDDCRRDPDAAARINTEAPIALARFLAARGAFVVLLSTDRVFSGADPRPRADAPHSPVTEYGRQKAAAENGVLALGSRGSVVRLTKVAESLGPLLGRWNTDLRADRPIFPFSNMMAAPVPLSLAVEAVVRVAERRLSGITQVSANGEISYAEIADLVARRVGTDPTLVHPVPAPSPVPTHASLDASRLRDELGLVPPDPRSCVESLLNEAAA